MNDELKKIESQQDSEFEAVLDRELGRILNGSASVEECCAANPGFARELRPLLQLALSGQSALMVEDPPSSAALTARDKLMAQAAARKNSGKPGGWLKLRPLVLASGLFLLLFAGTALAAGSAEPDSPLYPLKQRLESARTTLAIQEVDRARVEAEHANNRLDELQKMIDAGKGEYSESLLAHYRLHIDNASAHAAAAASEGEDTSEVDALIATVRARHDEMVKSLGLEDEGDEGEVPGDEGSDDVRSGDSDDMDSGEPGGPPYRGGEDDEDDDTGSGGAGHQGGGNGGGNGPGGGNPGDDDGYRGGGGDQDQSDSSDHGEDFNRGPSHDDSPKQDDRHSESSNRNGPTPARS